MMHKFTIIFTWKYIFFTFKQNISLEKPNYIRRHFVRYYSSFLLFMVYFRVSHFRLYFFFASKRNEAKQKPFRFLFASFCETKKIIFRFVSLPFASIFSLCFASFFQYLFHTLIITDGGRREEWGWTSNFLWQCDNYF